MTVESGDVQEELEMLRIGAVDLDDRGASDDSSTKQSAKL